MRQHTYFVAWIASTTNNTKIGNNLISTKFKGEKLLRYAVEEVQKDVPNAVITSIQRLD